MRILNFPYLVYDNILKHLEPSELLLFSFCSLKTRALVSRMRHTPTHSIFVLDRSEEMNYALVDQPEKEEIVITWNWENEKMGGVRTERIKAKYIDLECRITFKKNSNTPVLWCSFENQSSRKRFATSLHSYMCEVFHVKPEMQFKLSLDYMDELPNTNTVRDVTLLDTNFNPQAVDQFFDNFHVTRALFSKSHRLNNPLKNSIKFHRVNNLFLNTSCWLNPSQFLEMDCENLVMAESSLQIRDLISFVNQWLEGSNTRLKTMYVLSNIGIDADTILDHFDSSPWNPEVDKLEYNKPIHEYCEKIWHDFIHREETRNGVLERKCDGLRAIIRLSTAQFHFHVLHNKG
ncbi:hypothetical protein CRE_26408 [Caenorhabditis remanei]|uniref:F-box domain-containing protein n=1 Tax=Caenorhabditis remanei TaxID=31234 RepID=E3LQB7_CAERE|nr:hypothetical protein CRE_26408 [Caenorhabditis remanei]